MARKTNCEINGYKYFKKTAIINGKRKPFYGTCELDANRKIEEAKKNEALGLIDDKTTVGKALDIYIYNVLPKDPKKGKSTFAIYEGDYRNKIMLYEPLMNKILKDTKSLDVQYFIDHLEKKNVSYGGIQDAKKVLNMFFKYAMAEGYILKNPCSNAYAPQKTKEDEIEIFTDEEIKQIKNAVSDERERFLILLALSTGMRQGELLALRHSDFSGDSIYVCKQQQNIRHIKRGEKTTYELTDTKLKTKASYRTIPLPKIIQEEYKLHKRLCQKEKLRHGHGRLKQSDLVFLTTTGLRWQGAQIQKRWKVILMKSNVEYRKFHSLRHTFITKLIQQPGANHAVVMKLAGHSKYETTLRYTHVEIEHKADALSAITELLL